MCGISGFFDGEADYLSSHSQYESILLNMNKVLYHRGPDAQNILLKKCCGLAHTRLSIIDLAGGSQPMSRTIDKLQCHIVYNGELYNTNELREDLIRHGLTFQTTSDTEVILLGYMTYGAEFVKKCNGIFSFAIFDERHNTITLFRDPMGVKPLYYSYQSGRLIFSSEIKGIFQYPGMKMRLTKTGLNEIFSLGPAKTYGCGVFEGIEECLPGHYITFNRYGCHNTCYWRLQSRPHFDSYEETLEKTGFLVCDAIERQMVSDVPICTFLSGGIDSSLVSAVCANKLKEKQENLTTFSFDFLYNDKYFKANSFQPSQDRPYVDIMKNHLHSDHHYLFCDHKTQADLLYDSVKSRDLPTMADVDSSLLFFCSEVAKTNKVVLTGECADEIFGGYPWFHREDMLYAETFPWMPDLSPRKQLLHADFLEALDMDDYVKNTYCKSVSEVDILPEDSEVEANRRRVSYLNLRWFMQTLLDRMDRTSMHSGLEARVPFADTRIVEYAFNIPWEMKAKDNMAKHLLRTSCKHLLPHDILFRRKSPYPKTYNPYYERLLGERLFEVINDSSSPILPLLDKKKVLTFLKSQKDYGKPWYGQLMAGPQMTAYLLQINFWLKEYQIEIVL